METLRLVLLFVHILGYAALLGGLLVQLRSEQKSVNPLMRDGSGTAFLPRALAGLRGDVAFLAAEPVRLRVVPVVLAMRASGLRIFVGGALIVPMYRHRQDSDRPSARASVAAGRAAGSGPRSAATGRRRGCGSPPPRASPAAARCGSAVARAPGGNPAPSPPGAITR